MAYDEVDILREQAELKESLDKDHDARQNILYAPQVREQMAHAQAAIINQTNPAKALKIILEGFKGNIINEHGDTEKVAEQLMDEKGISKIASFLVPFINDAIRFGDINRVEVRNLALQTIDDITIEIGTNWRDYGIKYSTFRDIIIDALLSLILITLTRSEEGGEKKWLAKVVLESLSAGGHKPKRKGESNWEKYFKL